jgi:hypothetical protein
VTIENVLVKNVTYMWSHCHELACCNTFYLLTFSVEHSPSEATRFSPSQEIPCILTWICLTARG